MVETKLYETNLQVLIPVVFGLILTLLPSILGILLITKGSQTDSYLFAKRLNSPRGFVILLSLLCQVPFVLYVLFLFRTEAFEILFGGSG